MDTKSKLLNLRISETEFEAIKELAAERDMTISEYIRYMATIFIPFDINRDFLHNPIHKKQLEKDLEKISENLEKSKRVIELLQRSVYSTALKLESQFKKIRIEAAQELEKDIDRIDLLVKKDKVEIEKL
jgi:G:T-mismatch repair DNA endonuclease (very short patch repair protein)